MTKEELIRNLKYTMKKHENDTVSTFGTNISLMCKDVLNYLEQESCNDVLDKIRAEIEALPKTYPFVNHFDTYVKEDDVKKIIDKYKSESEEDDKE